MITLIGVAAIIALSSGQWIEQWFDAESLAAWVESRGALGIAVFVATGAVLTGVGLPRQLVALCAGYGFSVAAGVLLAIFSVSCGALLTFSFARYIARPWVRHRYPEATAKVDAFIHDQPFLKIVTIRFAPVGTNMLTNLAAGTTALPAPVFFTASALGFLPQTLIFVLIGNGLAIDSNLRLAAALVLAVISLILCGVIYRRTGK